MGNFAMLQIYMLALLIFYLNLLLSFSYYQVKEINIMVITVSIALSCSCEKYIFGINLRHQVIGCSVQFCEFYLFIDGSTSIHISPNLIYLTLPDIVSFFQNNFSILLLLFVLLSLLLLSSSSLMHAI